jgi:TetR/AcrR family transcriptional regulator, ethionamide resistance regulator
MASTHTPRFAAVLRRRAGEQDLRKTERTRLDLLSALAARLESGAEPAELRVADITAEAGLAHGTFYRYFTDRQDALEALVGEFARHLRQSLAAVREGAPASRARVRAATRAYVRLFRANAGLMRCLMDLGPDGAAFRAHFQSLNRDWNGRVAAAIARRWGKPSGSMLPTAYAIGGMIDDFLAGLYLRRDPALAAFAKNEAAVADLLTDLWCRAAYGAVSPEPR